MSVSQVDQYTSILLIESLTPEHNGNYSCVVRNLAAEVSHTHQLVVNGNQRVPCHAFLLFILSLMFVSLLSNLPVPPIIEPFSFQDGLSEGMRTRTVCGVSRGDPPLVVSWLKDGQPLTPALGVNVSALDPYSSLLSISSLAQRHSGDFTCVASNPAAEVRYTAKLQVKGIVFLILFFLLRPYHAPSRHGPKPLTSRSSATCPAASRSFVAFGTRGNASMTGRSPSNVWLTRYCCTFLLLSPSPLATAVRIITHYICPHSLCMPSFCSLFLSFLVCR